jgi:hypothetical protein
MVEDELAHYLEDQGLGTRGVDIFYGTLGNAPDIQICLRKFGGLENETNNENGTVRLEFPSVMVQVRGVRDDYDGPNLKIQKVVKAFTKIGNQTLYGVFYQAVLTVTPPYLLYRDDNFRNLFQCNLRVVKAFSDPG